MSSTNVTAKHKREDSTNRYILLYELFHSISSTLDPKEALNLIIDAAMRITGATCSTLSLIDWQRRLLEIQVTRGYVKPVSDVKLKVGKGITGWVAETGTALLCGDVRKDSRYYKFKEDVRAELAVPLLLNQKVIGIINVESVTPHAFSGEDVELLTLLAKQSAQVIRNSQLFETVHRKVDELTSLIDISKTITSSLSLDQTLDIIAEHAAKLMDSKICAVRLLSEDGDELILRGVYGIGTEVYEKAVVRVSDSLIGQVVLTEEPFYVVDVKTAPRYKFKKFARQQGLCSLLSVPLKVRDQLIGVLSMNKTSKYRFSDEELKLVGTFADLCAIAIENARLYENTLNLEEQTRSAERLAVVGELAVGIAHEIRNPLTIIKMIFESGSQVTEQDVAVIGDEMARMNKIITRFLDFARPNEPLREACNVNTLVRSALLLLSHALAKKHIKSKVELLPTLPKIHADPVQLQQAFLNLMMNAIEAVKDGGRVSVSTYSENEDWIALVVRDNGPGFDSHVKENLFVPFTTTKAKGLGVGLSIVKRIVDAHNGDLVIDTSERAGTKAIMRLPVKALLDKRQTVGGDYEAAG